MGSASSQALMLEEDGLLSFCHEEAAEFGVTRASFQYIQCTSGAKHSFKSCKRIWQVSSICVLYCDSIHEFSHLCPGAI
jgi:hypothetical protein